MLYLYFSITKHDIKSELLKYFCDISYSVGLQ